MDKWYIYLLGCLLLVGFMGLVWPRLHMYWVLDRGAYECLLQMNRVTGQTVTLCTDRVERGWESYSDADQAAAPQAGEQRTGNALRRAGEEDTAAGQYESEPVRPNPFLPPAAQAEAYAEKHGDEADKHEFRVPALSELPEGEAGFLSSPSPDEYYLREDVRNHVADLLEAAIDHPGEYEVRECEIIEHLANRTADVLREARDVKFGVEEAVLECAQ